MAETVLKLRSSKSGSDRRLRATWAKTAAPTWIAAQLRYGSCSSLNETSYNAHEKLSAGEISLDLCRLKALWNLRMSAKLSGAQNVLSASATSPAERERERSKNF